MYVYIYIYIYIYATFSPIPHTFIHQNFPSPYPTQPLHFCHQKLIRRQTDSAWDFLQPLMKVFAAGDMRIKKILIEYSINYYPDPSGLTSKHYLLFL